MQSEYMNESSSAPEAPQLSNNPDVKVQYLVHVEFSAIADAQDTKSGRPWSEVPMKVDLHVAHFRRTGDNTANNLPISHIARAFSDYFNEQPIVHVTPGSLDVSECVRSQLTTTCNTAFSQYADTEIHVVSAFDWRALTAFATLRDNSEWKLVKRAKTTPRTQAYSNLHLWLFRANADASNASNNPHLGAGTGPGNMSFFDDEQTDGIESDFTMRVDRVACLALQWHKDNAAPSTISSVSGPSLQPVTALGSRIFARGEELKERLSGTQPRAPSGVLRRTGSRRGRQHRGETARR